MNQPVDLVIKALKKDQILKNYEGKVWMTVEDQKKPDEYVDINLLTLPDDGLATFNLTDQGVKTYVKGLQLQKPGTYIVKVADFP